MPTNSLKDANATGKSVEVAKETDATGKSTCKATNFGNPQKINNPQKITPASTPNSLSHFLTSLTILTSNHVPAQNTEGETK